MPKIAKQLHEQLRDLLPQARAESCQVIATFLDIRGFSTFAARSESFDSALYLRSAYTAVLTDHFADADFFKPTGDGLLLIHVMPTEAEAVRELVDSVVSRAIVLVGEFGQITGQDLMVNFAVPKHLGVGIARGSATRLVSGATVLDYTGRCLNLAARLMDKARPSGVVFSDGHADKLLTEGIFGVFRSDHVCIRGIADQVPIPVLVTSSVSINPADREPVVQSTYGWGEAQDISVEDVREHGTYSFYLPRKPRKDEVARVEARYPVFDGEGKRTHSVHTMWLDGTVAEQSGGFVVRVSFRQLIANLKEVPPTTQGLFFTKTTRVTFTPCCRPKSEPD